MSQNMITVEEACQFLWQEAEMLDHRHYDDWLNMWHEDGLYIVPIEKGVTDHANHLNYAYDDAAMRDMRVRRLKSNQSMSASSAAETVRTVSRFVVREATADSIRLGASQHVYEYRRDKGYMLAADLDIELVRTDDGLKMMRKVITLVNSEESLNGLTYLP